MINNYYNDPSAGVGFETGGSGLDISEFDKDLNKIFPKNVNRIFFIFFSTN